jgi:hypothetical protein
MKQPGWIFFLIFHFIFRNRTSLKDDPKPTLIKINLNETDVDKTVGHVRIYESKLHQTDRAFGGLSDLDTLT